MDVDAPGRRIDADRIERLASHAVHRRNDVGVALVREVVVLVDREQLVLNRAAREAVCKAQPGGDAAAEPEDINRSVGKLGDDAIVARRADIGEDRPAGKRLADADRGRQAHRTGDQIARGQRACRYN